jgi:phosphohistidine phosphatase
LKIYSQYLSYIFFATIILFQNKMKRLVIIRHAKAEHSNEEKSDSERDLSQQGQEDALMMSDQLIQHHILPDLMFTSPAFRAVQTADIYATKMNYALNKIIKKDVLFHSNFHVKDFMKTIYKLDDKYTTVFVFGHNPYFSELAARLTASHYKHIPTSGYKSIIFDVDSWTKVVVGEGKLELFDYPENHRLKND